MRDASVDRSVYAFAESCTGPRQIARCWILARQLQAVIDDLFAEWVAEDEETRSLRGATDEQLERF